MTKFCPNCGTLNEDSAHFCVKCGDNFDQLNKDSHPNQEMQQNGNPVQNAPMGSEFLNNMQSLRSAFFWLFLGTILSIIPIISIAGGIIVFIGFILLIIGFGKISRSSLRNAEQYRKTRNWLLISLITGIIFIMYLIVFYLSLFVITTYTTTPIGATSTGTSLISSAGVALIAILTILAILYIIAYLMAYLSVVKSLRLLSEDLQVKKLYSAGSYLFYSLILVIISIIITPVLLIVSLSAVSAAIAAGLTVQVFYAILGALAVPIIIDIIAFILQLVSYHSAYTGIDEFMYRYTGFPPVSPPSPPVQ